MYLLEYNEKAGLFHHNYLKDNSFGSKLFSNGFKPVCVIPEDLCHNEEFERYSDELARVKIPYEIVVEKICVWILKSMKE